MKIIITESQLKMLTEATSLADDQDFRDTIKSYENEVVDATGKHYVFDDKDPKNPKTFVSSPSKKRGGTLTIGWGHTGPEAKIGAKITKSKAEQLLTADIRNEENKTKNLFPKYDTYPTYVRKALVNSVYRGEAKKGYKWVDAINAGNWDDAATKYLQGWNIDFSQANDPRYQGGVADRMVTNQEAFKKYANELKGKKSGGDTQTKNDGNFPWETDEEFRLWYKRQMYGKTVYPKNKSTTKYVNLRYTPVINNGYIDNKIGRVDWPNPVGVVKDYKQTSDLDSWYYVKLDPSVDAEDDYAWVHHNYVTTDKNYKFA